MEMNARELATLAIGAYGAMQKFDELHGLYSYILDNKISTETVVEIGSGRGGTLWGWCHLPTTKTAVSIDYPGGPWGGGLTKEDKERIENWAIEGQSTYLREGNSHDPSVLEDIRSIGPIDLLFIDGDHSYDGVAQDYATYSPLVRKGGLTVFHDVCVHPKESGCEVSKFWNELANSLSLTNRVKAFITEPFNWGGIGVIVNE